MSGAQGCVTWQLGFYSERRRTLARYDVEAKTSAVAQVLGREALLAEHRPPPTRRAGSLFEQVQRLGGQNAEGGFSTESYGWLPR